MGNPILGRLETGIAALREKVEHYRSFAEKCDQIEGEIITIETKVHSILTTKEDRKERVLKTKTKSPTTKDINEIRKLNVELGRQLQELERKKEELRIEKANRDRIEKETELLQNQIAEELRQAVQGFAAMEKKNFLA